MEKILLKLGRFVVNPAAIALVDLDATCDRPGRHREARVVIHLLGTDASGRAVASGRIELEGLEAAQARFFFETENAFTTQVTWEGVDVNDPTAWGEGYDDEEIPF